MRDRLQGAKWSCLSVDGGCAFLWPVSPNRSSGSTHQITVPPASCGAADFFLVCEVGTLRGGMALSPALALSACFMPFSCTSPCNPSFSRHGKEAQKEDRVPGAPVKKCYAGYGTQLPCTHTTYTHLAVHGWGTPSPHSMVKDRILAFLLHDRRIGGILGIPWASTGVSQLASLRKAPDT